MSKSTKYYAKIFAILFLLIASLMGLFLWMNHSINQNREQVVVAQTNIPQGVILSEETNQYLTITTMHADDIPNRAFQDMSRITPGYVTTGPIPMGTVITEAFLMEAPEDEEEEGVVEERRTDFSISVSPGQVSGGNLNMGDRVVIFGSTQTRSGKTWIGAFSEDAIVSHVRGDLSEGNAFVTFSIRAEELSLLELATANGNLNFMVGGSVPSQGNLFREDIERDLAAQVGIWDNKVDEEGNVEFLFSINGNVWNYISQRNESEEIPILSFSDFRVYEGFEEGALLEWEGVSPSRVSVRHFSPERQGLVGRYHGNYTLENDNTNRKIKYDHESGLFALVNNNRTTFTEEGLYEIRIEYPYLAEVDGREVRLTGSVSFKFYLESETTEWEMYVGYDSNSGNIRTNLLQSMWVLNEADDEATLENSRGSFYLSKNHFDYFDDFSPMTLENYNLEIRLKSLNLISGYNRTQPIEILLYENTREDLFDDPFERRPSEEVLQDIEQLITSNEFAGLLSAQQVNSFITFVSDNFTRREAEELESRLALLNSPQYQDDIANEITNPDVASRGMLLTLLQYLSLFDDRYNFTMTPAQNLTYYFFINTSTDDISRDFGFKAVVEDEEGNVFEVEFEKNFQQGGN